VRNGAAAGGQRPRLARVVGAVHVDAPAAAIVVRRALVVVEPERAEEHAIANAPRDGRVTGGQTVGVGAVAPRGVRRIRQRRTAGRRSPRAAAVTTETDAGSGVHAARLAFRLCDRVLRGGES